MGKLEFLKIKKTMDEIWKDIEGYGGLYQVSNIGRVKALERRQFNNLTKTFSVFKEKIMIQSIIRRYLCVSLTKNGKPKTYRVHRLVAGNFIKNTENKPCIDHINTINTDNRVENLKWCTIGENNNNPLTKSKISIAQKGHKRNFGIKRTDDFKKKISVTHTNHPKKSKSVLQIDIVTESIIKEFPSVNEVQRVLGFKSANIAATCRKDFRHKTAYGYKWEYKTENT